MGFTGGAKYLYKGKEQTITEWCRELDLPYSRVYGRLYHCGMSFEEAIGSGLMKRTPYKKRNVKKRIISETRIRVGNEFIDGQFVKHTARGLFKSTDGVTYIQDREGDFMMMNWKVNKKPKLYPEKLRREPHAAYSQHNGLRQQALRKRY